MKKLTRFSICIIILIAATAVGRAQNTHNCNDVPKQLTDTCASFFGNLSKSSIDEAYNCLLRYSPFKDNKDKIKTFVDETKRAFDLYGKPQSYELMSCEKAGSSLIRLRYLSRHPGFPMRWIFTFYESPSFGWIIMSLKFDDSADLFFTD